MKLTFSLIISIILVRNFHQALDFEVVELCYELGPDTLFYPGDPPFIFTIIFRGDTGEHW
jgi:hypothetical protein